MVKRPAKPRPRSPFVEPPSGSGGAENAIVTPWGKKTEELKRKSNPAFRRRRREKCTKSCGENRTY